MTDVSLGDELTRRVEDLEERVSLLFQEHPAAETNNGVGTADHVAEAEDPRQLAARLLARSDPDVLAARLNALGHPVRLRILLACLDGPRRAAELAAQTDMGSTGQIYHHLRQLVNQGWLSASRRGHYEVPREALEVVAAVLAATFWDGNADPTSSAAASGARTSAASST
ncbi:ArsR/SmtB family transcription factor [Streptomyces parvus]|uniref:Winged helix-turn-helix transcriptional regulator n=1 Tax=Streptomyces parvus TaxID=66428 RepID=A0A5D4JN33_9ACTN|nr:winged helix-turn-helix domain-containing protein [Streptomyces parvus]TYR65650.1 winged helix-turn-helix transcriptional regulator [Streptomyces parvus]